MTENRIIHFMAFRRYAFAFSLLLMVISVAALAIRGINFGLDFTGGTLVELTYSEAAPLEPIRQTLHKAGFERATVVNLGAATDVAIRLAAGTDKNIGQELVQVLQKEFSGSIKLRRVEFVGPQVGDDLREQGGLAVLLSLLAVGAYIAVRFQYKFSVGAVVGLFHDVFVVMGCFALFQWEFDLTVLAAVLAVIGSSVNDTIVVFDRIREVFRKQRRSDTEEIINISLTQTLDRTIGTKVTVLLTLMSLLIFGGEMIRGFSIALAIGTFFGVYSSTYVAASILMTTKVTREDLVSAPVQKEGAVDGRP
ncbi:MAG: protein-export rane protein SecF [Verrucomicrobiaceae bacterium]|nr:protein-export rane protein SecF [Verrucomicrobiaceae bacterium]